MPVGNKELIKIIHNAILSSKDGMAAESVIIALMGYR